MKKIVIANLSGGRDSTAMATKYSFTYDVEYSTDYQPLYNGNIADAVRALEKLKEALPNIKDEDYRQYALNGIKHYEKLMEN